MSKLRKLPRWVFAVHQRPDRTWKVIRINTDNATTQYHPVRFWNYTMARKAVRKWQQQTRETIGDTRILLPVPYTRKNHDGTTKEITT